jgi:hypothetical protein
MEGLSKEERMQRYPNGNTQNGWIAFAEKEKGKSGHFYPYV